MSSYGSAILKSWGQPENVRNSKQFAFSLWWVQVGYIDVLIIFVSHLLCQLRIMGQGQSQSGEKSSSDYAPSKGSQKGKSKRRSSGKAKGSNNGSSRSHHTPVISNSTYIPHSKDISNNNNGTKKSHTSQHTTSSLSQHHHSSAGNSANDSSALYTQQNCHHPQLAVVDTMSGAAAQRGSHSSGGERSAPSRQFSQTSTQNRHAQIEKYFNKYKDSTEDSILAEGMEKFCIDLGVDPTEFIVLVLAWKFEASQMCRFTREEFINGCQKMQAHNSKSLKERFPDLLGEARDSKHFKDLYNFTFSFGLDHSSGQRSLPIDMAMPLWDLVFTQSRPEVLDHWFHYLQESEVRGISRDTWNMFLPFVELVHPDLSNYDESEAWPSLFDDFVEAMGEKTAM